MSWIASLALAMTSNFQSSKESKKWPQKKLQKIARHG
jgi:hypothetical protein